MKMKWLLILLLVVILSIIAVQNNTALEWQAYDGDPVGIYAGGFVIVQDALYSIGGSSDKGQQKGNHQYDPATKKWTKKTSMKSLHKNGAYVSVNDRIHVIAGDPFSNLHEVYDPVNDEWSFLAPLPTKVQHVMGVTYNDKIYVMGGLEDWSNLSTRNQVYDIKTDSWVEMAPMPIGKHGYSSIAYDDKIYVFGTLAYDTTGKKGIYGSDSSIEVYDTVTDTWEIIGNMPFDLYLGTIVQYGDEVIIMGGFRDDDEPSASVDIFSLTTYTWRKGLSLPEPFVGMGSAVFKDQLYVSGGADPSSNWLTNKELFQIPIKKLLDH